MSAKNPRLRFWIALSLFALVALLGGVGAGFLVVYLQGLPSLAEVEGHRPSLVSKVYAADEETVLGEFFEEKRLLVSLDRIPQHLIDALIATEDRKFYEHTGIDFHRIAGAALSDLREGATRQGGSTITQQVTKSFLLTPERSYIRKLKEAILAYRIDKSFSKDEVLFLYLI